MPLSDYLTPDQIWLDLKAGSKAEILASLSRRAARTLNLPAEDILTVLTAREELGSTGLGEGLALPHGRLPGLAAPFLGLARTIEGVEFDSPDGKPIRLLALVLTGADGHGHLQLLARVGTLFKSAEAVAEMLKARSSLEILDILVRH